MNTEDKLKLIELAKDIATKAHEGQFRWDGVTPYITHPAAVAKAVYDTFGLDNHEIIMTAWLHDVVEDTSISLHDLAKLGIPREVVNAVCKLTRIDRQSYTNYISLVKHDEIARIVKVEDIKHNMSTLDKTKKKDKWDKYQLALCILENSI